MSGAQPAERDKAQVLVFSMVYGAHWRGTALNRSTLGEQVRLLCENLAMQYSLSGKAPYQGKTQVRFLLDTVLQHAGEVLRSHATLPTLKSEFDSPFPHLMKGARVKVIIAGCRWIEDYEIVCDAIRDSEFEVTEVVSGKASGIDTLGENWAEANDVPVKSFPAKWKNIKAPGAVVRTNRYGKYNAKAGFDRNEQMAEYADALVAIWDGESRGTNDMITRAHKHGLQVHVFLIEEQ